MDKRQHFHSFDAFRFISFLLVFLHHLPKSENKLLHTLQHSGGIGVRFFFVLSGFLITYILLFEKKNALQINLKNFFVRRILRIWPLFYAMILFAYIAPIILNYLHIPFSNDGYTPNFLISILFGENYMMMMTNNFPDGAPLRVMWSLCIEEHFYILWGILFFFIHPKKIPLLITISIIISSLLRIVYEYCNMQDIDVFSNLDYFAYGAIPAYIILYKKSFIYKLEEISIWIKYLILSITLCSVFYIPNITNTYVKHLSPVFFGILFTITIISTLGHKNNIHINNKYWLSKLGKYTYSLYLVHTIIILIFEKTITKYNIKIDWCLFTLSSLSITILCSVLIYHLFEKHFLKFKHHFYSKS